MINWLKKLMKTDYYTDKNEINRKEHLSPSGKYKLLVRKYDTKPGCWAYSRGTVYRVSDGVKVGDVKKNYHDFDFLFIDDHPNGHDYLVCGEDYQGQTVIELDSGKRRDYLPKEAKDGAGFCWASYNFNKETQILMTWGCHWACPYEYRFFDFGDPMSSWPEIEYARCIDDDSKPPIISGNTIKCFQTHREYIPLGKREWDDALDSLPDADLDNEVNWRVVEDSITTYRREGNKLVVEDEWISEEEQKYRAEQEAARKRYEEWEANFKATDPLYLKYKELVKASWLKPNNYESRGFTYDGWGGDWKGSEKRWCRRITEDRKSWTVDYEWAVDTGPVKLQIYKNGKTHSSKFFEHSVKGVEEAFEYVKELIGA